MTKYCENVFEPKKLVNMLNFYNLSKKTEA